MRPPVWHWLHRGVLDKPQSPAHEEEGSHSVCVCGGVHPPNPPSVSFLEVGTSKIFRVYPATASPSARGLPGPAEVTAMDLGGCRSRSQGAIIPWQTKGGMLCFATLCWRARSPAGAEPLTPCRQWPGGAGEASARPAAQLGTEVSTLDSKEASVLFIARILRLLPNWVSRNVFRRERAL